MNKVKDNFSAQPGMYARYRPVYPPELFAFLMSLVKNKELAWDVGTGNGQVAVQLSRHFKKVLATDISPQQISKAPVRENIIYKVERAEITTFSNDFFDLVTVAQAVHWFEFEPFYTEVIRTSKRGGIIAIMGYGLMKSGSSVDEILHHFYTGIIGQYWDEERKYIDENYETIPFPFDEIPAPEFTIRCEWTLADLLGYLETWSAVQHYKTAQLTDPVKIIETELQKVWSADEVKHIEFPVLLKVAAVK